MRQRRRGLLVGIIPAYAGNTGIWSDIVRFRRDHPRICGGTLGTPCPTERCTGIIPAYAGNTSSNVLLMRSNWDHPRICGEHSFTDIEDMGYTGSSPHMRGTRRICCQPTPEPWDHPRICGEHLAVMVMLISISGSSPHMRGTRDTSLGCFHIAGIIPAYAGNTRGVLCGYRGDGDHPRICGEHVCHASSYLSVMGSSPHMRGTPPACPDQGARRRIIPAYAGNTSSTTCWKQFAEDHPRICGEHTLSGIAERTGLGSSPHMRGTRRWHMGASCLRRIIPAYAGNTCGSISRPRLTGDHPRICGEHQAHWFLLVGDWGSSPHMRGTLVYVLGLIASCGIIPAYAGNTCSWLSSP